MERILLSNECSPDQLLNKAIRKKRKTTEVAATAPQEAPAKPKKRGKNLLTKSKNPSSSSLSSFSTGSGGSGGSVASRCSFKAPKVKKSMREDSTICVQVGSSNSIID